MSTKREEEREMLVSSAHIVTLPFFRENGRLLIYNRNKEGLDKNPGAHYSEYLRFWNISLHCCFFTSRAESMGRRRLLC